MDKVIRIPDLGVDKADVIELLVQPGDSVVADQGVIMVESDKASMEVPAGEDGTVATLHIAVGDSVTSGQDMVTLQPAEDNTADRPDSKTEVRQNQPEDYSADKADMQQNQSSEPGRDTVETTVQVPDLGVDAATVIELLVNPGDTIDADQGLVMVESDKASMEIPSPVGGTLAALSVKVGDTIVNNQPLATVHTTAKMASPSPQPVEPSPQPVEPSPQPAQVVAPQQRQPSGDKEATIPIYAGPAVRKLARQLGVDLRQIQPTGTNGRVIKDDVRSYVRNALAGSPASAVASGNYLSAPVGKAVDFSQFGEVEIKPMSRLHQLTADGMAKTLAVVPQVTQFDNANITELEAFRKTAQASAATDQAKLTLVAFLVMASARALRAMPQVNVSVDQHQIIHKHYCHIGLAVDTPAGLMVPVIRDADTKNLYQLAAEITELAGKARNTTLQPAEMRGGCFTISSLGGIGGSNFTPLVNHPEAAILGACKSTMQPVWNGEAFIPQLICPLALSYDHRAINGADGARFLRLIADLLEDPRRMLL